MSSIALPGVTAPALGAEAELVRRATRADAAAFDELFRRHGQSAWRLAQAMVLSRREAEAVVAEGFVRALRVLRRRQVPWDEPFRPLVLGGVYHAAIDRLRRGDQPVVSVAGTGDQPVMAAAFRSLPERWRAALWLTEVEGMAPERIAPILGVSAAVAVQVSTRGGRALADRLRQAGVAAPESVGPELRALGAALPASLAQTAASAQKRSVAADPMGRLLPAGWLGERASRPLAGVIGGMLALSLIGIGVVGQNGALGGGSANGSNPPPSADAIGVSPGHGANQFFVGPGGLATGASDFLLGLGGAAGGAAPAAFSSTPTAGSDSAAAFGQPSGSGSTPTPAGGGASTSSGAGGSTGGGGSPGGGSQPSGSGTPSGSGGGSGGGGGGTTQTGGGGGSTITLPGGVGSVTPPSGGGGGSVNVGGITVSQPSGGGVAVTVPNPLPASSTTPTTAPLAQTQLLNPTCNFVQLNALGLKVGTWVGACPANVASGSTVTLNLLGQIIGF